MVRSGSHPETDGVVRWRRIDLKALRRHACMSELLAAFCRRARR